MYKSIKRFVPPQITSFIDTLVIFLAVMSLQVSPSTSLELSGDNLHEDVKIVRFNTYKELEYFSKKGFKKATEDNFGFEYILINCTEKICKNAQNYAINQKLFIAFTRKAFKNISSLSYMLCQGNYTQCNELKLHINENAFIDKQQFEKNNPLFKNRHEIYKYME